MKASGQWVRQQEAVFVVFITAIVSGIGMLVAYSGLPTWAEAHQTFVRVLLYLIPLPWALLVFHTWDRTRTNLHRLDVRGLLVKVPPRYRLKKGARRL